MSKPYYTTGDIVTELCGLLGIEKDKEGAQYRAIRTKIRRRFPTLWQQTAISKPSKQGGEERISEHSFSNAQRILIMSDKELIEWLIHQYILDDVAKVKAWEAWESEYQAISEAATLNEKRRKLSEDFDPEIQDEDGFYISQDELKQTELYMMVEALFLQRFTPIDEEALIDDLLAMKEAPFVDCGEEHILAEQRLKHPLGNYYKIRLEDCKDEDNS